MDKIIVAQKSKPYDAEVEYLESTGTQYIDTGVIPTDKTVMRYKFMNLAVTGNVILGYTNGNDQQDFRMFNYQSKIYFDGIGGVRINGSSLTANTVRYLELYNYGVRDCDNNTTLLTGSKYSGTANGTITINGSASCSSNRSYSLQIKEAGVMIRDYIPVRVGTTGYLYDKINGQLYGNSGTGNFILGADVKKYKEGALIIQEKPYDAEIKYIESDGNQYIDTGIDLKELVQMKATMSITSHNSTNRVLFGAFSDSHLPKFQIYINSSNAWAPNGNTNYYTHTGIIVNDTVALDTKYTPVVTAVSAQQSDRTIYLFARNHDAGENLPTPNMRVYASEITRGGLLVRDYIPVRIGTTGYLYDKVSGQLFGNEGTGSFTLGPDVKVISPREKSQVLVVPPTPIYYWNGLDALNANNQWVDRIKGLAWNSDTPYWSPPTRQDGAYIVGRENGGNPMYGYHNAASPAGLAIGRLWRLEVDMEVVSFGSKDPFFLDFGSYQNCNHGFGMGVSSSWVFTTNYKGISNSTANTYGPSLTATTLSFGQRFTIATGCEKYDDNTDIQYLQLNGGQKSYAAQAHSPTYFNRDWQGNLMDLGSGRQYSYTSGTFKIYKIKFFNFDE